MEQTLVSKDFTANGKHYSDYIDLDSFIDLFESMPSKIDEYAKALDNSQKLNFKRWDILDKWVTPNVVVMGSYQGEVDYLKNWLTDRIDWMKKNMGTQPEKPKNIFDLNNDSKVNIGDLSIFSKYYGEYNSKMDFNKDNKVNEEDLQMLVNEILK